MSEHDMAQAQIETTDGVLILPRKVSWTVAASLLGLLVVAVYTASVVLAKQGSQGDRIDDHDRRITTLESFRTGDSERLIRVEEQMKFAVEVLKRLDDRTRLPNQ